MVSLLGWISWASGPAAAERTLGRSLQLRTTARAAGGAEGSPPHNVSERILRTRWSRGTSSPLRTECQDVATSRPARSHSYRPPSDSLGTPARLCQTASHAGCWGPPTAAPGSFGPNRFPLHFLSPLPCRKVWWGMENSIVSQITHSLWINWSGILK